jgi:hypothetical protein
MATHSEMDAFAASCGEAPVPRELTLSQVAQTDKLGFGETFIKIGKEFGQGYGSSLYRRHAAHR